MTARASEPIDADMRAAAKRWLENWKRVGPILEQERMVIARWGQPRATTDADFSVLAPYGEEEHVLDILLERATPWRLGESVVLRTCSAEDLVVYKLVAGRPQDLIDVEGIVRRRRQRLDVDRIRQLGPHLRRAEGRAGSAASVRRHLAHD